MNFQEEYFKRHSIAVPVVKYVKEGYLIFKNPSKGARRPKWQIMGIKESPVNGHPHDLAMLDIVPRYNGFNNPKGLTSQGISSITVDSYAPAISAKLNLLRDNGFEPVFGFVESRIALLEMFMFIWCNYLVDLYRDTIIKDYYSVLDKSKSLEERLEFVDKIDGLLLDSSSKAREHWREFKENSNPELYCSWLKSWVN